MGGVFLDGGGRGVVLMVKAHANFVILRFQEYGAKQNVHKLVGRDWQQHWILKQFLVNDVIIVETVTKWHRLCSRCKQTC